MDFKILGPLEVWSDGTRIRLEGRRQERLLAALLLNADTVVPVARLVDAVWDEDLPATAARQVRNMTRALRRRLAEGHDTSAGPVIVTDGPGYRLSAAGHRIDARTFAERVGRARDTAAAGDSVRAVEELRGALALWRGPALDGLPGRLLTSGTVALDELRLTAREDCLELELALDRHREAVPELSALVAEHPLRDRFIGQLMLALHRSGRQADGLAAYRRFAARLAEELGLDPSPELRSVQQTLLRAETAPVPAAQPDRRGAHPRPAQLPADLATFVGRAADLRTLDELAAETPGFARTAVAICAISGTAGAGKTALAVHWAHRARPRFPDGQLYVNLRGYADGGPLNPRDVLAQFLRALGIIGERIPAEVAEAAALYRSVLADRRILVVLDNARSAEHVRPLLPGSPTCLVLITSRDRLAGLTARDSARRLVLDVLSPKEAVALLARLLGARRTAAEPAATAELAAVCAHLPLALGIAASRFADQPYASLSEQVAELRAAEDRLTALEVEGDTETAVRAAFDLSYRALAPDARRLFRLLSLAPGPDLAAPAAAALGGAPLPEARRLLERLAAAHLLTHDAQGRYRLHDLLRIYAAERAAAEESGDERAAARERLHSWYLHHGDAAAQLLSPYRRRIALDPPGPWYVAPGFGTVAEALQWCESERVHLLGAVRDAHAHGQDGMAWRLPVVLWSYFLHSKDLDGWIEAGRLAVAAAHRLEDPYGEGHARNDLGTALAERGQHAPALDEFRQALRLVRAVGDATGEAHVLGNLGDTHAREGRYSEAVEHFRQALALLRSQPSPRDEWAIGVCEANLGTVALLTARYEDAHRHFHRALTIHRATGDELMEAFTLASLGDLHRRLGQPDQALDVFRRTLALIDRTTGNHALRDSVLESLAALAGPAARADGPSRHPHGGITAEMAPVPDRFG